MCDVKGMGGGGCTGVSTVDSGMLTLLGPEMSGIELAVEVLDPCPLYPELTLQRLLEDFIEFRLESAQQGSGGGGLSQFLGLQLGADPFGLVDQVF